MPDLKPGQNPAWDANTHGQDSNSAKPCSFPTEITCLVQDLLKLRLLMSHGRKNSVRDKVIGKKWIYLERNIIHRQYGPSWKERVPSKYGVVSSYGLSNFRG